MGYFLSRENTNADAATTYNAEWNFSENTYLNNIRKNGETVKLYVISGACMVGTIKAFDPRSILLVEENGSENLVRRDAISTIKRKERDYA